MLLGDYAHLQAGDEVTRTGRVMDVGVGIVRQHAGLCHDDRNGERQEADERAKCCDENDDDGSPAREPAAVQPPDCRIQADGDEECQSEQHEDLAGKVVDTIVVAGTDGIDRVGHGTSVAGVAGAVPNNGKGITGAGYRSSLINVKVTGSTTAGGDGGHNGLTCPFNEKAHTASP